jgi:NAD(P)-dependent dehydrogenase (short-subunit alcohol dehydrogenase family)
VLGDLASQQSIRTAAEEIRRRVDKVDVLINNAGGVFSGFELTVDGLERTIALNHFGYFLLTGLLLDLVKKSDYARIINVSSDSHYSGKIDFASFRENRGYTLFKAYRQSKLANVMFTAELADRLKGTHVTVNTLHPGTVKTAIAKKSGRLISIAWSLVTLFSMDAAQGAKTSIYLASSPEVKGVSGKYFDQCKPKKTSALADDVALRKKLWEVSEKLSGFSYPAVN